MWSALSGQHELHDAKVVPCHYRDVHSLGRQRAMTEEPTEGLQGWRMQTCKTHVGQVLAKVEPAVAQLRGCRGQQVERSAPTHAHARTTLRKYVEIGSS